MSNNKKVSNKVVKAHYLAKSSLLLFFIFLYILMPVFWSAYSELKGIILLVSSLVFLSYCGLRYYILLLFWVNREKAFKKQLFENSALLLGLINLYIFEGILYAESLTFDIPSYRFLGFVISCIFLFPTLVTNRIMSNEVKKQYRKNEL